MKEKIPPELVDALSKDKGFSLLIKGAPGTGKTLLALEIVRMFGSVNAVYLSTRVPKRTLYEQFPWLDALEPLNFIDVTKLYICICLAP
jgi:KaiC/GvpD/RAD55 family RecA-like ATPase